LLEQARPIWSELEDDYRGAIGELNIGLIHHDLGNFQVASEKYTTALSSFESRLKKLTADQPYDCKTAINPRIENLCSYIADAKDNLGELDCSLDDPDAALEKFNDSLLIRRALKQPGGLGFTLSSIAYAYLLKGDANSALKFGAESLPNSEQAKDQRRKAITLTFQGMAWTASEQPDKALSIFETALTLQREIGERRGEAITLDKMGSAYAILANRDKAAESFNLALQIWEEVGDEDGETISRYNFARLKRDGGDLAGARQQIDRAEKNWLDESNAANHVLCWKVRLLRIGHRLKDASERWERVE
jgi:tetratricopeptide (TPR) repeat protein